MKTAKFVLIIMCMLFVQGVFAQSNLKVPSIKEVASLDSPSNPQISPNGKHVLFQVRKADWQANRYDTEIWLSKNGGKAFQLTNNPKSSSYAPKWSPDGKWISFLSSRGDSNQIHVISIDGGEAIQAVKIDGGIYSYEWSPSGKQFAFLREEKTSSIASKTKEQYGDFEVEDEKYKLSWLYMVNFNPNQINYEQTPIVLIDNVDFTIDSFKWSPDGSKIAFNKMPNPLINTYIKSDVGILDVATKKWNVLVKNSGFDYFLDWSPDSKSIVYTSSLDNDDTTYYSNGNYFIVGTNGKNTQKLADGFDEELKSFTWTKNGIYTIADQKTKSQLFLINPTNGNIKLVNDKPDSVFSYSISEGASKIASLGETNTSLKEIFVSSLQTYSPQKLTDFTNKISQWNVGQSEIIQWKSKDGTAIEGVLHKPSDYNPSKKYPLFVVVHGGPTMVDRPTPIPAFYPILQWLNKGALVLRPNYRGSSGYGEKFRSLNVNSLGLGYAQDILSGVDYLDNLNLIDTTKMGCMGWSEGGYISAFLSTTSNRFKAISVGAGYANTKTYYVTTDLHPFMLQYLGATPWNNPQLYEKTSPISYIKQASTPTLIQHSKNDHRIPIANAYELLQGLRDVGVPTKMIIYKGVGHTLTKPKERLAGIWHNWQWFGEHIFGEDIELPVD